MGYWLIRRSEPIVAAYDSDSEFGGGGRAMGACLLIESGLEFPLCPIPRPLRAARLQHSFIVLLVDSDSSKKLGLF
jgi:hypothetical protein